MFALRSNALLQYICKPSSIRFFSEIQSPTIGGEKLFSPKIESIACSIAELNLLEVSDLNELLQKKLNIKPAEFSMPMAVPAQNLSSSSDNAEETVGTKSSFSVKLVKFDSSKKVPLIKELKSVIPDLNLVQAKKLVESAPEFILKDISKEEAEKIKKILTECGAEVLIE